MCSMLCGWGLSPRVLPTFTTTAAVAKSISKNSLLLRNLDTCISLWRCVTNDAKLSSAIAQTAGSQSSGKNHEEILKETLRKLSRTYEKSDGYSSNTKVLLIGSSSFKSLLIKETPVLHHAPAEVVLDLQPSNLDPTGTLQQHSHQFQLKVDQLLKDAKSSVKKADVNQQPSEKDVEYVEEAQDCARVKAKLVGALPARALEWRSQKIVYNDLISHYAGLSKSRLTGLVVLSAIAGYVMAPSVLDPATLVMCSIGTGLTSSAANSINQFFEVPFDSQMDRTKNRILVRGVLTPYHAVGFAAACGSAGISLLYFGANGVAASLGMLNLVLYTCAYTPLKRISIINTWVGSIVGAIPPLIGWSACTGGLESGAWIMAGILFAWQFPHFNALSWNLRPDYSRAGYRMMSVTDPGLCRRVALRYSVAMIGICLLAPAVDVTTWTFAVDSLPVNGYLAYLAWRFYQDADSKSSRKLFMYTLIHLPAVLVLMIISKKYSDSDKRDALDKKGWSIPLTSIAREPAST